MRNEDCSQSKGAWRTYKWFASIRLSYNVRNGLALDGAGRVLSIGARFDVVARTRRVDPPEVLRKRFHRPR